MIDISRRKTWVTYAKTKVWMHRLSDAQIARYVGKAGVCRLAGSFDIQGDGARLVRRIAGSYSNVVGLPLEKLLPILRKIF